MRLRKPTGSLVLDRSIRDGDLARDILVLPRKSKQSNATPTFSIVLLHVRFWSWCHNTNVNFPATSKRRRALIAVALFSWASFFNPLNATRISPFSATVQMQLVYLHCFYYLLLEYNDVTFCYYFHSSTGMYTCTCTCHLFRKIL